MSKLTIKIPDELDAHIDEFLVYHALEIRDKSRIILFAIEKMIANGEMPDEFLTRCQTAKDCIRDRQKKRYQEMRQ
jgi:hypothetical protein